MQKAIDDDVMGESSLVSIVNGNGNFGFDWTESAKAGSSESGGIAGLTKAMLIESWMRGIPGYSHVGDRCYRTAIAR